MRRGRDGKARKNWRPYRVEVFIKLNRLRLRSRILYRTKENESENFRVTTRALSVYVITFSHCSFALLTSVVGKTNAWQRLNLTFVNTCMSFGPLAAHNSFCLINDYVCAVWTSLNCLATSGTKTSINHRHRKWSPLCCPCLKFYMLLIGLFN